MSIDTGIAVSVGVMCGYAVNGWLDSVLPWRHRECVICKVTDGVRGSVATICAVHYARAVEAAEHAENAEITEKPDAAR